MPVNKELTVFQAIEIIQDNRDFLGRKLNNKSPDSAVTRQKVYDLDEMITLLKQMIGA